MVGLGVGVWGWGRGWDGGLVAGGGDGGGGVRGHSNLDILVTVNLLTDINLIKIMTIIIDSLRLSRLSL